MDSFNLKLKEESLLLNLKNGEEAAFRDLYDEYAPFLLLRLKRLLADKEVLEEIHHDVFLRIWKNRQHVDITVPIKAILLRTAKSLAIDYFRKALREKKVREQFIQLYSEESDSLAYLLDIDHRTELMQLAISKLPPQRQRIFKMIKFDEKNYKQVADELGLSVSTIKDHMAKAMVFLRKELVNNQLDLWITFILLHAMSQK